MLYNNISFASIIILLSSANVDPGSNNCHHSADLLQQIVQFPVLGLSVYYSFGSVVVLKRSLSCLVHSFVTSFFSFYFRSFILFLIHFFLLLMIVYLRGEGGL